MSTNTEGLDCKIPVNLVLAAAHRLFAYDKMPLALALIKIVLDQYPNHARARTLQESIMGLSPEYPVARMLRLHYDPGTGLFFVEEKGGKGNIPFKTLEEAEQYLRALR